MTVVASNTQRWRIIRWAVLGAIALNVVTVAWASYDFTGSTIVGAVALAVVGALIGGSVGWATTPNRSERWWAQGRPRGGSVHDPR
jgi:hypothetical protein